MSKNSYGEENRREPTLNDTDKMPFGKYQGTPMQDVPPSYLKWLYEEIEKGGTTEKNLPVYNYVYNSWDAIQMELGEE